MAAAVALLDVRVVRELVWLPVVELPVSEALESVMVDELSSVVRLPVAVAVPVVAPDEAGREAVPEAPATVKAGAKLKFCGFVSSVMRKVYWLPAATTSAGMVKEADPAAAGTLAARVRRDVGKWIAQLTSYDNATAGQLVGAGVLQADGDGAIRRIGPCDGSRLTSCNIESRLAGGNVDGVLLSEDESHVERDGSKGEAHFVWVDG